MHDEDLNVGPLLARLVGGGVVMLDAAQSCTYADDCACDLLGAPDVASIRNHWPQLHEQLHLPDLSPLRGEARLQHRVDLAGSQGGRRLRVDVLPLAIAGYVVLLRDVSRLDAASQLLILASEAQANRPAVSGLVHGAKGPLNNFHLTLALLASILARAGVSQSEVAATRWQRYLDVLDTEAARLTACINEIDERAQPINEDHSDVDVNGLVADVARLLRHTATLRDVAIKHNSLESKPRVHADPQALRLALVAFTLFVLDRTPAQGRLALQADCDDLRLRIHITGAPGTLPDGLANTVFQLTPICNVRDAPAIAARIIAELHSGEVSLIKTPPDMWGFAINLPAVALR